MQINVRKKTLYDGSCVFDVELEQGGNSIFLTAPDEKTAREIACEFRDTARASLEDVPEWEFIS